MQGRVGKLKSMRGRDEGVELSSQFEADLLFLDVTDLLLFSTRHGGVSGIQRVTDEICILYSGRPNIIFIFWTGADVKVADYNTTLALRSGKFTIAIELFVNCMSIDDFCALHTTRRRSALLTGAMWSLPNFRGYFAILVRYCHNISTLIHDIIPLDYPDAVSPGERAAFNSFLRAAKLSSRHIITFTETAADSIAERMNLPRDAVVVVPGPTKVMLRSSINEPPVSDLPFALIVSTIEPRKNHATIFQAWGEFAAGFDEWKLICVGRTGYKHNSILKNASAMIERGNIVILSNVSDVVLARLYKNCQFVICPSYAEGWGLSLAEGLGAGKFALASDLPSHRAIGGESLPYIKPDRSDLWQNWFRRIADDASILTDFEMLIETKTARTWQHFADDLLNAARR